MNATDLVRRRRAAGMRQEQLGRLAGVSLTVLNRIEKGRRPLREDEAERLAAVLAVYERAQREAILVLAS